MKKIFILVISILVLSGCSTKEEEHVMKCNRTINNNGVSMDMDYTITYSGNYVKTVNSVEKVTSGDASILESYETQIEAIYEPYGDIEYYEYEVDIDGNTLTSTVNIDYSKIDTDKLIYIDSANATLIKNGKINIDDMISNYTALGITCNK